MSERGALRAAGWLGSGASALFGFLHAPRTAECRSTPVLIVPPLGHEAICAHAALRRLAERLTEHGFVVLRYDHPNSGDSGGDADPGRLPALAAGLGRAIDELRARCAAARVALVGLRLGALLALEAARDRDDVASVVAWAPPLNGRSYVRELRALGNFSSTERDNRERLEEIAGFGYATASLNELGRLDPKKLDCPPGTSILIVPRDDVASTPPERWGPWASRAEVRELPGYAAAVRDPHEAVVSEALLDGIASWLSSKLPERAAGRERAAPEPRVELGPVVEEAVSFGPGGRLFGVVTRPRAVHAHGPCVLFLNAGAIHRIGMNRNYVTLARDWASRGVTCLRFDGAGLGDSASGDATAEGTLYSRETVGDVKSAIDFLAERHGAKSFVLAGLCAGAYTAFHAALADARVTGAFIINPQTFDFRPGDSLSIRRRRTYRAASWYRRSALRVESWRKMLRGQVDLLRVGRVLGERLALYAERRFAANGKRGAGSLSHALASLCQRGTRLLLVYSADDPGLEHVRDELGGALDRLLKDARFALEVIDDADHTFTGLSSQQALARCLQSYLGRWHETAVAECFDSPPAMH